MIGVCGVSSLLKSWVGMEFHGDVSIFREEDKRRCESAGDGREESEGGWGVGDEREKVMGTEREDKYFRKFSLSYYTHMEV